MQCSPFRISPTLLASLYESFSHTMLSIVVEPFLTDLAADCLYSLDCHALVLMT